MTYRIMLLVELTKPQELKKKEMNDDESQHFE